MNEIVEYIKHKYNPVAVIVYGSYSDGSSDSNSDFDALIISKDYRKFHDVSIVNGVQLDVYIYPENYFEADYDYEEFIQIYDGKVVLDNENKGSNLKDKIIDYLENKPFKTEEEIKDSILWCIKMLERIKRKDVEGAFRFHWLLIDSLEIFCDIVKHHYSGPKKALAWMNKKYPEAFRLYKKALIEFNSESLTDWILYLKSIVEF